MSTSTPSAAEVAPAENTQPELTSPGAAAANTQDKRTAAASSLHERLRDWVDGHIAELPRFWTERPPSPREHLAYARHGDWHPQPDGPARRWHLAYTWAWVVPGTTVAHLFAWAIAKPGRFFPLLVVVAFLATALNTIPIVSWFVPDWATVTYWPPFS